MREVDAALERVYADQSRVTRPEQGVPRPHVLDRGDAKRGLDEVPRTSHRIDSAVELEWPPLVLELERAWGDRFDRLAAALDEARQTTSARVILFTSCHRAEGRTTLVLALARALARRPLLRTLIVDADLTGPMLAKLLGLRPAVGLEDLVNSHASLSDTVIQAAHINLAVLPLRSAVANPREFTASPGWSCTIARLRREFDLVILDGGPMFLGLSVTLLHRSVDAAVLVRRLGASSERGLSRAQQALESGGIRLLGLAETFT